ncbi:MAG: Glycosyltransferase [Candidatus Moranbacteria bacterium GW2011_GWE1_36_7]|nr:MAG: Glycosyltransferase [Candidatus Moranbacteria bacterium GW2011_GWE1_36_7]
MKKNKKIIFALAGDGSELDAIKKIFNNEKIDSRQFRYFGVVRGQTKIDVYSMIDIFVCASKSETQGMIISEAMYVGLPIVAVGATGVSDLITNQVNGLLVKENEEEFANAIERLASDRNLRIKFSENAKRIAKENYTASVCTQKMLKIYEKAISRKK